VRLPDRDDILDYVEGASGQDAATQKRILQLLASSQVLREHVAELKKDLYVVSSQVPDYAPNVAFAAELTRLSQSWVQVVYVRRFSLRNFYRSKELFGLLLLLLGLTLLVLGLLGMRLLAR